MKNNSLINIDKQNIIEYINKSLKDSNINISHNHIESVLNIFIEEFISLLLEKKKIRFNNFGTFKIKKRGARKVKSIFTKEFKIAKETNKIYFFLSENIKKILIENLDIEKTLQDRYEYDKKEISRKNEIQASKRKT